MPRVSAFAGLDAIPNTVLTQPRCRVRLLPRCCGTYALYDRGGDLLGWRATTPLAAGLAGTLDFYREHPWYLSST